MTVTVSGRLVVAYSGEDDADIEIEVPAGNIEIGDPELHDGDRGMGPELVYTATAEDEQLGDLTWRIYEYPAGVLNHVEPPRIDHTVLEWPEFSLVAD